MTSFKDNPSKLMSTEHENYSFVKRWQKGNSQRLFNEETVNEKQTTEILPRQQIFNSNSLPIRHTFVLEKNCLTFYETFLFLKFF